MVSEAVYPERHDLRFGASDGTLPVLQHRLLRGAARVFSLASLDVSIKGVHGWGQVP